MDAPTLQDRLLSAAARFRRAVAIEPARQHVTPPAEPRKPSEAEVLHALVASWARSRPDAFDAHFVDVEKRTHEFAELNRKDIAEVNFWLGYEKAIRDVRAAFVQWSHPYAGTPPVEPAAPQGGSHAEP